MNSMPLKPKYPHRNWTRKLRKLVHMRICEVGFEDTKRPVKCVCVVRGWYPDFYEADGTLQNIVTPDQIVSIGKRVL